MAPVRCWSSGFTTALLQWRNPQGSEENWMGRSAVCDSYFKHTVKVLTTEAGVAILTVTSAVETVAYGVGFFCSIPFIKLDKRPLDYFAERASSSGFTFVWNIGNLTVFNFFYPNIFTNESLARYAMDHLSSGVVFHLLVTATRITSIAYVIFWMSSTSVVSLLVRTLPALLCEILRERQMRPQDREYIANWAAEHALQNTFPAGPVSRSVIERLSEEIAQEGAKINEGTVFFEECILKKGQINEDSRKLVMDRDASAFHFVMTHCVYLYVVGLKKDDLVPRFFKVSTQEAITDLRKAGLVDSDNVLLAYMRDCKLFDQSTHALLVQLKIAASQELQGSLFLQNCWGRACDQLSKQTPAFETELVLDS